MAQEDRNARAQVVPRRAADDYLVRVRKLIALALVLAACRGSDRSDVPASRTVSTNPARGPDALLLRVPRNGGVARVTAYPQLDSTVWTSSDAAPALDRVLAFDPDAGLIAAENTKGAPVWIDLRVGSVTVPGKGNLRSLVSVDGSNIYGVGADGAVARFTQAGNWLLKPPRPARAVFPQTNGTALILGGRGDNARIWRVHPPDTTLTDSTGAANATGGVGAPLGDRVFVSQPPAEVRVLRARTLQLGAAIKLEHRALAMATSPSGDRAYVVLDSSSSLAVVDSYQNSVVSRTELPGRARDLRVDPFGRYVLVRAATGDSVWVVSVGTDKVTRTVRSQWRGDLPFVAVDGSIVVTDGPDVLFHGARDVRVPGGASDFWYPFMWNGLRPRAASLDSVPVVTVDSDSVQAVAPPPVETLPPPPAPVVDTTPKEFTVSFAVFLDEAQARDEASKISVNGQTARVVTGMTSGTAVFRVILGPFPSREEADRVGRASNRQYVIYAGAP
jgi:hypothetical protein